MVENGANQDSCESGSVPLTVTADPNLLTSLDYFTMTAPSPFTRSKTPFVVAPVNQSVGVGGAVTLSISSAPGYADNGFYIVLGTLGSLNGYTINGTGSSFGDNLYLGTNSGEFFEWSSNVFTADGVTSYGFGPTSVGGTVAVTGSSLFYMNNAGACTGTNVTLTALKSGSCAGIGASTPVALWVGLTLGGGGSGSTTITSVTAY
jgi:hypothetical protein